MTDWEVWFPASETVEIASKSVLVRELSWEQIEECSKFLGTITSELVAARIGLGSRPDAASIARKLFVEVPAVARKLIVLATDVPDDALGKAAGKVVPMLLAEVFKKNKELKDSFFELGVVLGLKVRVAKPTGTQ